MQRILSKFAQAMENLNRHIAVLATVAIAVMMFSVVADIVIRATGHRLIGVLELNKLLMVFAIFMGIAFAQTTKTHVRVDFLVERIPKLAQMILDCLILIVVLALITLTIYATTREAIHSLAIKEYEFGSTRFPIGPVKMMIPIGCGLLCVQLIIDIIRVVNSISHHISRERLAGLAASRR